MRRSDRGIAAGWALLGATLTVGAAAMITAAQAQGEPPPPAPPPAAPNAPRPGGGFGGGGFGGGGQGQPGGPGFPGGPGVGPMRGFGMGAPVMTATDRFVYVLRGNTLYQFSVDGLRLVNQAQLPPRRGESLETMRPGAGRRPRGGAGAVPGSAPAGEAPARDRAR